MSISLDKMLIKKLEQMSMKAQDNLLHTKISQAVQANKSCMLTFHFAIGGHACLSTMNKRQEFKGSREKCVAKFMPCYNRPYTIVNLSHLWGQTTCQKWCLTFPKLWIWMTSSNNDGGWNGRIPHSRYCWWMLLWSRLSLPGPLGWLQKRRRPLAQGLGHEGHQSTWYLVGQVKDGYGF